MIHYYKLKKSKTKELRNHIHSFNRMHLGQMNHNRNGLNSKL
jgi:hypothetical protein